MQRPRNPDDDDDDTAFGGLAPRSGPGRPKLGPERRSGAGKWLVAVVVVILALLLLRYVTGWL